MAGDEEDAADKAEPAADDTTAANDKARPGSGDDGDSVAEQLGADHDLDPTARGGLLTGDLTQHPD